MTPLQGTLRQVPAPVSAVYEPTIHPAYGHHARGHTVLEHHAADFVPAHLSAQ